MSSDMIISEAIEYVNKLFAGNSDGHEADVVIDPEYQHQGLGTALVSYAVSRPVYQGLRGILLTKNAHGLYRKFGFELNTERAMIK